VQRIYAIDLCNRPKFALEARGLGQYAEALALFEDAKALLIYSSMTRSACRVGHTMQPPVGSLFPSMLRDLPGTPGTMLTGVVLVTWLGARSLACRHRMLHPGSTLTASASAWRLSWSSRRRPVVVAQRSSPFAARDWAGVDPAVVDGITHLRKPYTIPHGP
jgi:hypothetical protein